MLQLRLLKQQAEILLLQNELQQSVKEAEETHRKYMEVMKRLSSISDQRLENINKLQQRQQYLPKKVEPHLQQLPLQNCGDIIRTIKPAQRKVRKQWKLPPKQK